MFKRLVIELAGQFCECADPGYIWKIVREEGDRHGISITCRACGASEVVASENVEARITITEMRAPKPVLKSKPVKRSHSREGNVITLFPQTNKDRSRHGS